MIVVVLIIVGIVALGIASLLDLTPDTRDPAYGLGPLFSHRDGDAARLLAHPAVPWQARNGTTLDSQE